MLARGVYKKTEKKASQIAEGDETTEKVEKMKEILDEIVVMHEKACTIQEGDESEEESGDKSDEKTENNDENIEKNQKDEVVSEEKATEAAADQTRPDTADAEAKAAAWSIFMKLDAWFISNRFKISKSNFKIKFLYY